MVEGEEGGEQRGRVLAARASQSAAESSLSAELNENWGILTALSAIQRK